MIMKKSPTGRLSPDFDPQMYMFPAPHRSFQSRDRSDRKNEKSLKIEDLDFSDVEVRVLAWMKDKKNND